VLFGSIDYLNLLPFQVFMKKNARLNIHKKRSVPSVINSVFHKRQIDAAFISSITSKKCECTNTGIVGIGSVYSVLLIEDDEKIDNASQTSNALAQQLNLKGEVLIGDRALRKYLGGLEAIDLSKAWSDKHGLPFVFARLCYHKHGKYIKRIAREFSHTKVFIPQYIIKKEAKKRAISTSDARWYLEHIHYKIRAKERKSLNLFLRKKVR